MAQFYNQIDKANTVPTVKYYFAYGMNTNIGEMGYRCPNAVCIGPARIKNYRLAFRTHADIERADDEVICGVLWKITPNCEYSLDMLEGYPYYYDKQDFIVELDKPMQGKTHVVAMAYQMVNQNSYNGPGQRYLDCLLEGYADNRVDADQIYKALEMCNEQSIEF